MDAKLVRETLLETLLEMFGAEKKYELEDYIATLTDDQILALSNNFSEEDETEVDESQPEKSDESAVDTFVTTLIQNMNKENIPTSQQINIIDGTLNAIKKGSLTITNNENE